MKTFEENFNDLIDFCKRNNRIPSNRKGEGNLVKFMYANIKNEKVKNLCYMYKRRKIRFNDVKPIEKGLIVDGKVYYKIEDKNLLDNDCGKCDLSRTCKSDPSMKCYCNAIYINGYFKKMNKPSSNSAILSNAEVNFNNHTYVTKWDPRYEGCKSCIIYKKYVDP